MATIEYWIQIENHAWDACPNNIDRMMGMTINPNPQPVTGSTPLRNMAKPLDRDALIIRRNTPNWAAPDDRKINPWGVNEPDPRQTLGTLPGAVIECDLANGDDVLVHFRNMDTRVGANGQLLDPKRRAHSLHPHGFVFESRFDGAYPLSPPDPNQPVGGEAAAWASVAVGGNKKGDRVPGPTQRGVPGGTFTYHWQTFSWPTTSGVWLYHDHSICDMDNVTYGAIGLIVIHNSADPEDILAQDLPGGDPNGSPVQWRCFPPPFPLGVDASAIALIGERLGGPLAGQGTGAEGALRGGVVLADGGGVAAGAMGGMGMAMGGGTPAEAEAGMTGMGDEEVVAHQARQRRPAAGGEKAEEAKNLAELVDLVHLMDDIDRAKLEIARFGLPIYRQPPQRGIYLQRYHELGDGRRFLGNTPTVIAGPQTRARFGVVGMGNMFHTFHIHGHRWIIPGPHGTALGPGPNTIQSSVQDEAVSQFEDTRIFGPANSFFFTIHEDDGFMRPPPGNALGEWHMHCHVLQHMDVGMMGSLLIINQNGGFAFPLPSGTECPPIGQTQPPPPNVQEVRMAGAQFTPKTVSVARGTIIHFINDDTIQHSATSDDSGTTFDSSPSCSFGNLGACLPSGGGPSSVFVWTTPTTGTFPRAVGYHCRLHGAPGQGMFGTITIT
ncbi:MAG: hypothetical protein E6G60_16755 [Actinobacteria bacterium]|nr:MAG: hypothetical protein E6G60_16755 [Actinomycetota bacterium]